MSLRWRTRGRSLALQFLYMRDLRGPEVDGELEDFLAESGEPPAVRDFARRVVTGVLSHRATLDRHLAQAAENWELGRMATVDRNILRLGAWELLYGADTPPRVAINEAIELGKRFGSPRSGAFINGILDRIHRTLVETTGENHA